MLGADVHAQCAEALACLAQQVTDAFHGVDLQAQCAEDGGLVAGAGADFQHALRRDLEHRLGHPRNHPGLRDGLAMSDRQRGVFICARGQCFIDEQMARHHPDRVQGGLVDDAGLTQAVDQTITHALRGHADTDGFRLQSQAWTHAGRSSAALRPPTQLATFSSAW